MEPHFFQFGNHVPRLRESVAIEREDAVLVHIVNIEMNHVAWYALVAEGARQSHHFFFAFVAVFRLVVAKRPLRRHLHPPGQCRIAGDDLLQFGAIDEVVIVIPRLAFNRKDIGPGSHIEGSPSRVIEKNAAACPVMDMQQQRDRLI